MLFHTTVCRTYFDSAEPSLGITRQKGRNMWQNSSIQPRENLNNACVRRDSETEVFWGIYAIAMNVDVRNIV